MDRRKFLSSGIVAATFPTLYPLASTVKENDCTTEKILNSSEKYENAGFLYKDGMPVPFQWFADDRLSFEMDELGVTSVIYKNPLSRKGNPFIFKRRLFDGFRLYIEQNHVTHSPPRLGRTVRHGRCLLPWRVGRNFGEQQCDPPCVFV